MMWTQWIGVGATMGALGVGAGAFGAHALKARLDGHDLAIFETAVRYQFFHVFAIMCVGLVCTRINHPALTTAGWLFVAGTLIFSGSLYALVLTDNRWLGAVTPIGGALLIAGWIALAYGAFAIS